MKKLSSFLVCLAAATCVTVGVLGQAGGSFVIEKSVIGGGGGQTAGGTFTLDGTVGQPFGGTTSLGGTFEVGSGFWGGGAALASSVAVSGKVLTPDNRGLRNAVVKLLDQPGGNVVASATTSTFGVFTFPNVPTGQTYTIKVLSKLYRFNSRSQTVGFENLVVADFVGME